MSDKDFNDYMLWKWHAALEVAAVNLQHVAQVDIVKGSKDLPNLVRAVYLLEKNGSIVYVGQTTNLRLRWQSHHLRSLLHGSRMYWLVTEDRERRQLLEQFFILRYRPYYNDIHDNSGSVLHLQRFLNCARRVVQRSEQNWNRK